MRLAIPFYALDIVNIPSIQSSDGTTYPGECLTSTGQWTDAILNEPFSNMDTNKFVDFKYFFLIINIKKILLFLYGGVWRCLLTSVEVSPKTSNCRL